MESSLEFRFVLDCCRASFGSSDAVPASRGLDWARLLRLVRFHRVQGLVAHALSGSELADRGGPASPIFDDAAGIAARNLLAIAACERLREAADRAGLIVLFVKGVTLGALAYGSATIKAAVDVDLVVPEDDVGRAAEILDHQGYDVVIPSARDRVKAWHQMSKESLWRNRATGIHVDLHSRLSDNPRLIPSISANSPRQAVEVAPGISIPTLAADELFAYLAVHGAWSAWYRLKWIADLAAFVRSDDVERLYRRSQELGAGRTADQALLLADRLFGTLEDVPDLRLELAAGRTNRMLVSIALNMLTPAGEPVEPTSDRLGTLPIHISELLLLPGLGFKVEEAWRQARVALGNYFRP